VSEIAHLTAMQLLAAGPPEATVTATNDAENGRVVLVVTPAADTSYINVWRGHDEDGLPIPVRGCTFLAPSAPLMIVDYEAPLNRPAEYSVNFFRWDDEVHRLDFIREATVTPTSPPEFTTVETFVIAQRGTVHVVANPDDVDPHALVDKLVRLDGALVRVTAIDPGTKTHLGLLVRGKS
jgi:hypothetical protein